MNYYEDIKNELINNEINRKVKSYSINKSDLNTYYNVGKMLSEAGKHYGEGIIKEYSKRLTYELGTKFDVSSLNKMRKFYMLIVKMATVSPFLSYSHYIELLPYDDINKIKYYINITIENNLSVRELRRRIKLNEYERLPIETRNKMISNDNVSITDLVPNPIIIKNNNEEIYSEKILHKLIVDSKFNYIDLLLFNYEFNCFVVVELKVCELRKEHVGQILIYMNYIDKNIKRINHDKTIGIIICKKNNEYVIEYCSDKRIISREYKII